MMAKTGEAASAKELRTWSFKKLIGEIRKQIRPDVGGGDMLAKYKKKALAAGIPPAYADKVAEFVMSEAKKVAKGSRDRVESKLKEIERRWDIFGKAYSLLTSGES